MSRNLPGRIRDWLRPPSPLWACEFTTRHVIVAGVDSGRSRIVGRTMSELPSGVLAASLIDLNIRDRDRLKAIVRETLGTAGFKGAEIGLVIPDESARVTFLTTDSLPKSAEEQQTFLRWKLKKTVPFDVDMAQIAVKILGPHGPGGFELLVALSPRSIVEEYESMMESLDVHAGSVVPSTLAAMNLMNVPSEDALFVKVAPDCTTTTVFQNRNMKFYRRVAELGLYESVYPTVLYYQDKLGGAAIRQMIVCGYDADARSRFTDLQERIGLAAQPLEPRNIDDVYKPALGAVHFSWANLI